MNNNFLRVENFKTTAVLRKSDNCYHHFNIKPSLANLYGVDIKDIEELEFIISDNQEISKEEVDNKQIDYWGWYDYSSKSFTQIHGARFLLNMCFPYGIKASEDAEQGKAYRIKILDKIDLEPSSIISTTKSSSHKIEVSEEKFALIGNNVICLGHIEPDSISSRIAELALSNDTPLEIISASDIENHKRKKDIESALIAMGRSLGNSFSKTTYIVDRLARIEDTIIKNEKKSYRENIYDYLNKSGKHKKKRK